MDNTMPTHISDAVPEGKVFLTPRVHPVVYLTPRQREPTAQQEWDAIIDAYIQAAKRGEVGVIKFGEREGK